MKLLKRFLLLLGLLAATPGLAETVVVHEGGPESADVTTRFAGAYNALHADFYVNETSGGIAALEAAISSTTSHNPAWVTIYANDISDGAYGSASAWVTALNTHIANIRAAVSGVKVAVITPLPKTGDATYTARYRTAVGLLRAEEGNQIDRIIDFAANPTMGPDAAASDANLYSSNVPVICTTACTLSGTSHGSDPCFQTPGGSKGNDFLTRQYACAMGAIIGGKYPWTVYPIAVTYSVNPVVPTAGTAPAFTLAQPDDIPTAVSLTGWTTTDPNPSQDFKTLPPGDTPKFRTIINSVFTGRFDPERNPGQAVAGHCHLFFGNAQVTGSSNYVSLRGTGASAAGGGPINPTAYWEPCLIKANAFGGDGITRAKIPNLHIVYYVGTASIQSQYNNIPRGLAYVGGTHMDDPLNLEFKAELNGNVSWISNGFNGWYCESTGYHSTTGAITNADGTDALNNCPSSSAIYASLDLPACWDRVNLRSPDGYGHMRPVVRNNNSGQPVCPDNYGRLPELQVKSFFSTLGAADYITYRLDSDDAAATAAGQAFKNGQSFHIDWFGAWDYAKMVQWMNNCIGTEGFTPHECDYSVIGDNVRMITDSAAPDGSRNPQINLGHTYAGDLITDWFDYPPMSQMGGMIGHRARGRLHKKN